MSHLTTPSVISGPNGIVLSDEFVSSEVTWKTRVADYMELSKAKIAVMVLITVAVGYLLGSRNEVDWFRLFHALLGIGLIAASSCALNQWYEISTDLLMPRTKDRPLPAGRIKPNEALVFAALTGIYGAVHLMLFVNITTMLLTLCTLVMYVAIYTPLKRRTSFCTAIGAVPGAFPPVLGWAASGQPLGWDAFWLFSLMFLWQFPHFFAIAWMYREQYTQAGLWMLPDGIPKRYVTGFLAVTYAIILLPVSLLPQQFGMTGTFFFWTTLLFGLAYIAYSIRFLLNETRKTARALLFCSLFYLPVVLTTLTWNHLSRLNAYTVASLEQTETDLQQ